MFVQRLHKRAQAAGLEFDVVVQQHHELGIRFAHANVQRRRHPDVDAQRHDTDRRPLLAQPGNGAVSGTVVHYEHPEIAVLLSRERR